MRSPEALHATYFDGADFLGATMKRGSLRRAAFCRRGGDLLKVRAGLGGWDELEPLELQRRSVLREVE